MQEGSVSIENTLALANAFVMTKEKIYAEELLCELDNARTNKDSTLEEACLDEVVSELRRLDPKLAYDHEEVQIYRIIKRGKN
jgi:hypothetical protein